MWENLDKEMKKKFLLSLDLVSGNMSDDDKLKLLYTISNHPEEYYEKKYIPKKDGAMRKLLVPKPVLKSIQRNILNHVFMGISVSPYATAYIPHKSLKDNSLVHVGKKIILKLDIKDFFAHIDFELLYRVLPNSVFPPSVKVLLLKLCTYEDYLPQGAPTSPYLSNLAMKNFDSYIGKYCLERKISYTRYSDDLTFSGDFSVKDLIRKVDAFLDTFGFRLNEEKTKVLRQYHRQIVTGVVVNKKINAPKVLRKKIRQEMYYIKKYGVDEEKKKSMLGKINYVLSLNPNQKEFQEYKQFLNREEVML